jgi:hypothetical protein
MLDDFLAGIEIDGAGIVVFGWVYHQKVWPCLHFSH